MSRLTDLLTPNDLLNHSPGFFGFLTLNSKLITVNKTGLAWIGCTSEDAVNGLAYENLNCKAAEDAELFIYQDSLVKSNDKPIYFIGCYCYAGNNWRFIYGKKFLVKNSDGEPTCIVSHFDDVSDQLLIDKSRFLIEANERFSLKIQNKQFCYFLDDYSRTADKLSRREQECLFYLIRGQSDKMIAKTLGLSPRTVEGYVIHIKYKFGTSNRSELIEKAIFDGFMNVLPASLLDENQGSL